MSPAHFQWRLTLLALPPLPQITDSNQELLPIWSPDKGDKYIGFLPYDNDYSRPSVMRAFLSGGFLLSRDYGVDVRVVSTVVDLAGTASTVKFQWKLSTQKVSARSPPPHTHTHTHTRALTPAPSPTRRRTTPR